VSYRLVPPNIIIRIADGKQIPMNDPTDPDFIAYQAWLAAGNLLMLATPPTPPSNAQLFDPSWSWGADFAAVIGGQPTGGTNVG
jgi:hypothetical protein